MTLEIGLALDSDIFDLVGLKMKHDSLKKRPSCEDSAFDQLSNFQESMDSYLFVLRINGKIMGYSVLVRSGDGFRRLETYCEQSQDQLYLYQRKFVQSRAERLY